MLGGTLFHKKSRRVANVLQHKAKRKKRKKSRHKDILPLQKAKESEE